MPQTTGARRHTLLAVGLTAISLALVGSSSVVAASKKTKLVSVSTGGTQGEKGSFEPDLSADGRFIVFASSADKLVGSDSNGETDIFIRDRKNRTTRLISKRSDGTPSDDYSDAPSISGNGRFVAFNSDAKLHKSDTDEREDVYLRDRKKGRTWRVSVKSNGSPGTEPSDDAGISANGRFIVFTTDSKLVSKDKNGRSDVYIHDRVTRKTKLVSVKSNGKVGTNGDSDNPAVSASGRYVAFQSDKANLVPGDDNSMTDVFVRDRKTGKTRRVSVRSNGKEGNGQSVRPAISADGRYVVFASDAGNLVKGDKNGDRDVFVHDRKTGKTRRASRRSNGDETQADSGQVDISANGRWVVYVGDDKDIVPGDGNGEPDVFIFDRKTGKTRRHSKSTAGIEGTRQSSEPAISADGRWLAFDSLAEELVATDSNDEQDVFQRGPLR